MRQSNLDLTGRLIGDVSARAKKTLCCWGSGIHQGSLLAPQSPSLLALQAVQLFPMGALSSDLSGGCW